MREPEFVKVLNDLVNSNIGLFLLNQHFLEGVLLAVKQDHVVMDRNQKVHYISLEHIKTLSKNAKYSNELSDPVPYLESELFIDILSDLKNSWVAINDSEKDAHFGVLSRISEDHIVLINHAELLYIPLIYISNIHGVIPEEQIHLTNQKRLTNQQIHPEPVNYLLEKEDEEVKDELQVDIVLQQEIDQPQEIAQQQDVDQLQVIAQQQEIDQPQEIVQQQDVDQLQVIAQQQDIDQPQEIAHQQDVDQLQVIAHQQDVDQLQVIAQQQDMLERVDVFNTNERAELQSAGNITVDNNETTVSINLMSNESQEIQDEVQNVEDYEGSYSISTVNELKVELPEENSFSDLDTQKAVAEVEDYSAELDDWGEFESSFIEDTVGLLSFSDPLGYERRFPLSFSKNRKNNYRTNTPTDQTNEQDSLSHNDLSIQLNDNSNFGNVLNRPTFENRAEETDNSNWFTDEELKPSKPTQSSITIIKMTIEEEKAMLEEQYFSLAKHAANYSQNNRSKHPVDEQYISLMNHAAKMYRQLIDK